MIRPWLLVVVVVAEFAGPLAVRYPLPGSIFPPGFAPPTFIWSDSSKAALWRIRIGDFSALTSGPRPVALPIDERAVAPTNRPPELPAGYDHSYRPDVPSWAAIERRARGGGTLVIEGLLEGAVVSSSEAPFTISADPVGAPIFYRDVPLMPAEGEKGIINPIAPEAVSLIQWRIRNVSETGSKIVLANMPTCANCHSFSSDGKTLGMDLDGPRNEKGIYTLARVEQRMTVKPEEVIEWSTVRGRLEGAMRLGFMSQVSPDGKFVITRINGREAPKAADQPDYYVANFREYGFLQVFYPTRGMLAWYSRETGHLSPLPGADDPDYVQTSAFWSPDGKYLVFARARAQDPYPAGAPLARYANDPNERQVRFDLYTIPFNEGRGGTPQPLVGASNNGMSNSFPKVSPDGKWVVFVKSRNGQLLRPDGELTIVPAQGGVARRMRCNQAPMNSWHSFSPNGRWMVFSSKARGPYTQMYLTHIDPDGMDSPAILIENATAANRAVNLPEFVNIGANGLERISIPAVESYAHIDAASRLLVKGDYKNSIAEWRKALDSNPGNADVHNNLALALAQTGQPEEAITHYRKAVTLRPQFVQAQVGLASLLGMQGRIAEAVEAARQAVAMDASYAPAHNNLGVALLQSGNAEAAIVEFREARRLQPALTSAHSNLGSALAMTGRYREAADVLRVAVTQDPASVQPHLNLAKVLESMGRLEEALTEWQAVLRLEPSNQLAKERRLALELPKR